MFTVKSYTTHAAILRLAFCRLFIGNRGARWIYKEPFTGNTGTGWSSLTTLNDVGIEDITGNGGVGGHQSIHGCLLETVGGQGTPSPVRGKEMSRSVLQLRWEITYSEDRQLPPKIPPEPVNPVFQIGGPLPRDVRIVQDSKHSDGAPTVEGTGIRVKDIATAYERSDYDPDEITQLYPDLELGDIHRALAYYYDHIDEFRLPSSEPTSA